MTLRHIKIFIAVCDTGSTTAGGKRTVYCTAGSQLCHCGAGALLWTETI